MINYFYKITNLINNHFYYGVHKTNNLEDGYMGSGKRSNYAIKKYGKENFKKDIIQFFDTYQEALDLESEIVNEELVKDINCYNLSLQGKGTLRQGPALINKETRELIKPNNIEEFNKLFNTGNYFGHTVNHSSFIDENGERYYLNVNDNQIKELNLHGLNKGRISCKDLSGKLYFVEQNDDRFLRGELIKFGMMTDKKQSEECKKKIGQKNSIAQKGKLNSQYGTSWINKDGKNKKIIKEELKKWIQEGWNPGSKFKK
jgi:hypothetical protein